MIFRLILFSLFATSSVFAGLLDQLPETEKEALKLAGEVVTYKEIGSRKLEMHIFRPDDLKAEDKRPAMLFIHGGGWRGGDPSVHAFESLYFSRCGFVTVTISYRLLSKEVKSPEACLSDARDALLFLRKNAEKYKIDPKRILCSGGSAGGHLAAALSTVNDSEWNRENYPNAMILLYPAFDLVNGWKGGRSACLAAGIKPESFSPAQNINKGMPPTLILSGSKDNVVNPESVKQFAQKLKSLKINSRYIEYDGKGHKLFIRNKNDPHFRATIYFMEVFLKELGWLDKVRAPAAGIACKVYE